MKNLKKKLDFSGLVTTAAPNTKVTEVKNKKPRITGLATNWLWKKTQKLKVNYLIPTNWQQNIILVQKLNRPKIQYLAIPTFR